MAEYDRNTENVEFDPTDIPSQLENPQDNCQYNEFCNCHSSSDLSPDYKKFRQLVFLRKLSAASAAAVMAVLLLSNILFYPVTAFAEWIGLPVHIDAVSMSASGSKEVFLLIDCVISILSFAVSIFLYVLVSKIPMQRAFPLHSQRKNHTVAFILAPFILCGVWVCGSILTTVAITFLSQFDVILLTPVTTLPDTTVGHILFAVRMVLIPAVCEELLFRGVILQSLRAYGDKFALIFSSFLFAVLHGNLAQAPSAFIFGLLTGMFVIWSGNILCGVLCHLLSNSAALMLTYLAASPIDFPSLSPSSTFSIVLIMVSFITSLIWLHFSSSFRLSKNRSCLKKGERRWAAYFNPMMLLFYVFFLFFFSSAVHFAF